MVVTETDGFESGRFKVNEGLGRGRWPNSGLAEVRVLLATEDVV